MTTIVLINYHKEALTAQFVHEELSKLSDKWNLVVVNNGATTESDLTLAQSLHAPVLREDEWDVVPSANGIYILSSAKNLGFARGNNWGAQFAKDILHTDYLLFSNNDIQLHQPDTIGQLEAKMKQDTTIGMIGPSVVGLDGKAQSPEPYHPFWQRYVWMYLSTPFLSPQKKAKMFDLDYAENATEGYHYKVEKEYAKAWEIGGMSGRSYQNARDYRFQAKVDQAQKSLATYQNFDSKRFENILTPEEKENFYREREIHEKREKAVQMIAAGGRFVADKAVFAATVTAAAAGATFSAYGGSQAMRDAGTVTGAIGNVAARSVVKIGGLAGRIGGRAYVESPVNISKSKEEKAGGMVNAGVAREVPKKGETPRQTSGMGKTSNQSSRKSSASNQGPKKSGASSQSPKKSGASNQSPKMNGASNQEPRKKEASRQEPKKKEVSNKKTNSVSSQNAGKKAEYSKIQNSQGKKRSGSRSTSQKPKGRASGKTKKKASSAKKKSKK